MLCGMQLRTQAFREECEILRRHAYKHTYTYFELKKIPNIGMQFVGIITAKIIHKTALNVLPFHIGSYNYKEIDNPEIKITFE